MATSLKMDLIADGANASHVPVLDCLAELICTVATPAISTASDSHCTATSRRLSSTTVNTPAVSNFSWYVTCHA